jgi:hypothetical protein
MHVGFASPSDSLPTPRVNDAGASVALRCKELLRPLVCLHGGCATMSSAAPVLRVGE